MPARNPHGAPLGVQLDLPPGGTPPGRQGGRGPAAVMGEVSKQFPVAVVTGLLEREPDAGVDRSIGQLGGAQRDAQRESQQRPDVHLPAGAGVDP